MPLPLLFMPIPLTGTIITILPFNCRKPVLIFSGGGFIQPEGREKDRTSVITLIEDAGYSIAYGMEAFEESRNAQKVVLLQDKSKNYLDALPYAIDRKEGDMTHEDIVRAAVEFLENENGFFLMSESGRIDWAGHSNDGKTAILKTLDLDEAVQVAVEFHANTRNRH